MGVTESVTGVTVRVKDQTPDVPDTEVVPPTVYVPAAKRPDVITTPELLTTMLVEYAEAVSV